MARILIIDDQLAILKMIESLLRSGGHTVTTAVDGHDALEKAEQGVFEMVITDAVMPGGISGFDVVTTLRAKEKFATIPMILLTGKREKKDVDRGIESGVDDYIVKPVDPDVFLLKVNSLLSKSTSSAAMFTDVGVLEEAVMNLKFTIVGVSEIGMTIRSSQPAHPNSKIDIQSEFFTKVGMEVPRLRVVESKAFEGNYIVRVEFIGLTEASLQPLRLWLRQTGIRSAG